MWSVTSWNICQYGNDLPMIGNHSPLNYCHRATRWSSLTSWPLWGVINSAKTNLHIWCCTPSTNIGGSLPTNQPPLIMWINWKISFFPKETLNLSNLSILAPPLPLGVLSVVSETFVSLSTIFVWLGLIVNWSIVSSQC